MNSSSQSQPVSTPKSAAREAEEPVSSVGRMKTEKTWWMLEHVSGEGWLANADHETFTRDPNAALRWPNETRANSFRRGLHHALYWQVKNGATEHKWVELPDPAESGAGDGAVERHSLSATDEHK